MKRRLLALLLALAMVCGLAATAFAAEEEMGIFQLDPESTNKPMRAGGLGYRSENPKAMKANAALEQKIFEGLSQGLTEINVSSFRVSPAALEDSFLRIMDTHPELFYVDFYYTYYYNGNLATKLVPNYLIPLSQVPQARKTYDTKIDEILSGLNPSWNVLQQMIYLHDYMVDHYTYDLRFMDESTKRQAIYDAYNLLTQGTGVCQAYTGLYTALMQKIGVPVSYAGSEAMDHIWNVVQIGGNWYHIDVTWDDPVPNDITKVHHENFLRSDSGMRQTRHHDWECDYVCSSTYYDDSIWLDFTSAFVTASGVDCGYPTNQAMYAISDLDNNTAVLYLWNQENTLAGQFTVTNCFHSSLQSYNGYLIYNDDNNVYMLDVYNSDSRTVYSVNSDYCITGFDVTGNSMTVKIFRYANSSYSTTNVSLPSVAMDQITITQYPHKLIYSPADEWLDLSGLQVSARYSDGRTYTRDGSYIQYGALSNDCNYLYFWLDGKICTIDLYQARCPFRDVPSGEYYSEPVLWAVERGITSGTSATTFAPNERCTRGQIVTFLWRAAGKPTPSLSVNPFKDVKPSDYYYQAVLWAVEKGITTGTSNTRFSPDDACTRGQVVTFLYRYHGKPGVNGSSNFNDVRGSDYYFAPVIWAVQNGITNGTGANRFSPDETCTRGQIVTFLYRDAT